jgi:hypothetical protein
MATSSRAPYFVMAHHRSGSNFLNDLLQAHPGIECINEPFSMHTEYFRKHDLEPWTGDDFDPVLLHPSLASHETLRSYLFELRAYLSQSSDGRVIGFKDTVLFEKLDWLKAFMPRLKILFLKRDPRSIVSSVLRSQLLEFWDYARLVPPAFQKMRPHYVSRIDAADSAAAAAEIVAMSVVTRYEFARRTIRNFENMEVDLGDLIREPAECLEAITEFLGVPLHQGPMAFLKERQVASRGGTFSSFRRQSDVQHAWERHLSASQVRAIEEVMQCR